MRVRSVDNTKTIPFTSQGAHFVGIQILHDLLEHLWQSRLVGGRREKTILYFQSHLDNIALSDPS